MASEIKQEALVLIGLAITIGLGAFQFISKAIDIHLESNPLEKPFFMYLLIFCTFAFIVMAWLLIKKANKLGEKKLPKKTQTRS